MGSDSVGGIWNGRGLWELELELDLDRNWTGESDRCDRNSSWIRNRNLCFRVGSM